MKICCSNGYRIQLFIANHVNRKGIVLPDAASAHSGACALGQRNWNIVSHPRQEYWASCAIIGGGTEHLASSMCENWTPCAIHDKEKWASCAIIGARTEHLALSRCVNWTSCAIPGVGNEHLPLSRCRNWTPCAIHDKEKWASCDIIKVQELNILLHLGVWTKHLAPSRCGNSTSYLI